MDSGDSITLVENPLSVQQWFISYASLASAGLFRFKTNGNASAPFDGFEKLSDGEIYSCSFGNMRGGQAQLMLNCASPVLLAFDKDTPNLASSQLVWLWPETSFLNGAGPGAQVNADPHTFFRPARPVNFTLPRDRRNFRAWFHYNQLGQPYPIFYDWLGGSPAGGAGSFLLTLTGN